MNILSGVPASGLDIFLKFDGNLTDPNSIVYTIRDSASTFVASGSGFKISKGHYDARNTSIPSGFDISGSWTITWTFTSPADVSSSGTESFTLVESLSSTFSETSQNVPTFLDFVKVNLGLSNEISDASLTKLLKKTIFNINRRLQLTGTNDQLVFNTSTNNITPSPNDDITVLILLQMEYFSLVEQRRIAVGRGIRIKDGDSEIDTTASFGGHDRVVLDMKKELDDAIINYMVYKRGPAQHAKDAWYANQRIFAIMSHDGEGSFIQREFTSPFDVPNGFTVFFGRC